MNRRSVVSRCLAGLVLATALHAAPVRVFTPGELATRAELVVVGRVVELRAERDAAGRPRTLTRLAVAEAWKGALAGDVLTVAQGGGVLGQEAVESAGEVRLAVGDRVVAFLRRGGAGDWIWVARDQGCFAVTEAAGQPLAGNGHWGAPRAPQAGVSPPHQRPLGLGELRRRVEEAAP